MLDKLRKANWVLIKREQFCRRSISASLSKAILPLFLSSFLPSSSLSPLLSSSLPALQSFGIPLYLSYTTGSFREAEEYGGIHYVGRRFSGRDIARS